jgi:uncharacterized protein (UPF0276 family)
MAAASDHPSGIGIGVRMEFARQLVDTGREVDWVEIVPENWLGMGGWRVPTLARIAERWTVVPHSISMSIGGLEPLDDMGLFTQMRELCRRVRAPFWSDHISFARIGGLYTHDLLPLPFNAEAVEHTVARITHAQRMSDVPLVFENPTFYSHMPGATMDEATFLITILEQTGCDMLLDVNNVYVNSQNHGFEPRAFIDRMPLDRVVQLHVAGHTRRPDAIIDTHVGPVPDGVWELYRYTLRRAGRVIPTLLEWDLELPALDQVLDEVDLVREHAVAALATTPATNDGAQAAVAG